jgi:hypothetical protein
MGEDIELHALAALPPGKESSLVGGPQSRSGLCGAQKHLGTPSPYTDCTIRAYFRGRELFSFPRSV